MTIIDKESAFLGFKGFLPILPPVVIFGLIFGFTGGLAGLPLLLVSSSSFIIFAGSAQFIVILLIISEEPLIGIVIAGIIINLRHILYGAALHHDISARGLKRFILAYLLTDEAFLVTTLVKKELNSNVELQSKKIILDDVLFGAGISLWTIWNITTIVGYLLTDVLEDIVTLSPDFVVAIAFLGYLISRWQAESDEHRFIILMIITSFALSFYIQSSTLLIITLLLGALFAMIGHYRQAIRDEQNQKLDSVPI